MSNSKDEQRLLAGATQFDQECLAEIYSRYNQALYRYAMRLLGNESTAEECVADTFSRFLKALHANQGPREYLQAYLFRIAHNWITDYYRRQSPEIELNEMTRDPRNASVEQKVDVHLEQEKVRNALRTLTPDQRQVVMLRFLEGFEIDAVAAAIQKPISAVKALQFRAIHSLRRLLLAEDKRNHYESELGT
jgi:RNA polymerase sigma-70 factor, ECF subfamily